MYRNRFYIVLLIVLSLALGLPSRIVDGVPDWYFNYGGDAVWAMLVYWGFAFLFPRRAISKVSFYSLSFAYAIELSQLYQEDWINSIRQVKLCALVLGYGFSFSDIVCYSVGVTIAATIDYFIHKRVVVISR